MAVIMSVERDGKPFKMGNTQAKVLVSPEMGAQYVTFVSIKFEPGAEFPQHHHECSEDVFFVVAGSGWFKEAEKLTPISKGDVVFVPAGENHGTVAGPDGMAIIGCQGPPDEKLLKGQRDTV